jgi:hypothetical protein
MQDNYQFKQLGLIYESMNSMINRDPEKGMTVKIPVRGHGVMALKYNKAALEPFLSKQNDSIEDFLAAIGVPDPDGPDPGPRALLKTSDIEYLVRMLNREYGTNFFYDDVDLLLADGGERDDEEDAEGSYM